MPNAENVPVFMCLPPLLHKCMYESTNYKPKCEPTVFIKSCVNLTHIFSREIIYKVRKHARCTF